MDSSHSNSGVAQKYRKPKMGCFLLVSLETPPKNKGPSSIPPPPPWTQVNVCSRCGQQAGDWMPTAAELSGSRETEARSSAAETTGKLRPRDEIFAHLICWTLCAHFICCTAIFGYWTRFSQIALLGGPSNLVARHIMQPQLWGKICCNLCSTRLAQSKRSQFQP